MSRSLRCIALRALMLASLTLGAPAALPPLRAQCSSLAFGLVTAHPAGSQPQGLALGDFNHDGLVDLAIAEGGSSSTNGGVRVVLGATSAGGGQDFASGVLYPAGVAPVALVLGDFSSDGVLDLAVANVGSNVTVVLGRGASGAGDGTFGTPRSLAVIGEPRAITTGDFNEDGILDLVVGSDNTATSIAILLGNGLGGNADGTFGAPHYYVLTDMGATTIVVGDFDEDGILDLAATIRRAAGSFPPARLAILRGLGSGGVGNGTFGAATFYTGLSRPRGLVSADFNLDGVLDLAVADVGLNRVAVYLGNGTAGIGNGTFGPAVSYDAGNGEYAITAGDFDRDGILDIAVAAELADLVVLLKGRSGGDGSFQALPGAPTSGHFPVAMVALQLGPDSCLDVITANWGGGSFSVLKGTCLVIDTPPTPAPHPVPPPITCSTPGPFGSPAIYDTRPGPRNLVMADFDGDGPIDVVTSSTGSSGSIPGPGGMTFSRGMGSGGTGTGQLSLPLLFDAASGPFSVTSADFDADTVPDIAVANAISNSITIHRGKRPALPGQAPFWPAVAYAVGAFPTCVLAGDLNRDRFTDIVSVNEDDGTISILTGQNVDCVPIATFNPALNIYVGWLPISAVIADFNRDQLPDIAVSLYGSNQVAVLMATDVPGQGSHGFLGAALYEAGPGPFDIRAVDLDRDTIPDLIVTNRTGSYVTVLSGIAGPLAHDVSFGNARSFAVGPTPSGLEVSDLNQDGIADLAVGNPEAGVVKLLRGGGSSGVWDGTFTTIASYAMSGFPYALAAGDLNGDDRPDLVIARNDIAKLSVLLGGCKDIPMPTPTQVSLVRADAEPGRVRLVWHTSAPGNPVATIFRREATLDWRSLAEVTADASDLIAFEDESVLSGNRYGYRLAFDPSEGFTGETWIDIPTGDVLSLAGLRPNPSTGDGLAIAFSLPDAGPAALQLIDLAGRIVLSRDVGALGAGSHVLYLGDRKAVPAGIYFLRLRRGSHALTTRACVVH